MQTPPPDPMQSNYPRPDCANDKGVLREVAAAQRQVMYCVLAQLAIIGLNVLNRQILSPLLAIGLLGLVLILIVFQIISVLRLAKAVGESQLVYAVLMFIPCLSLLALLSLSQKATTQLKQAGIAVGLMGADPNSIN